MKNLLIKLLGIGILTLPGFAFATPTDQLFTGVIGDITSYLTGSFGSLLCFVSFIGALIALSGHAPMKVMFTTFGVCLSGKYGPVIIPKIFGATSDVPSNIYFRSHTFSIYDLSFLMGASLLFVIAYYKNKQGVNNE